jgi:hypothetical protein
LRKVYSGLWEKLSVDTSSLKVKLEISNCKKFISIFFFYKNT